MVSDRGTVTADGNTVPVLMTTVMSVHIVSGPVYPVSLKSDIVEPITFVRVLVGVPVGITFEGFSQVDEVMPNVPFPRLGEALERGGSVRVVPNHASEEPGHRSSPLKTLSASFPWAAG